MKRNFVFILLFAVAAAAQAQSASDTLCWRYLELIFPPLFSFDTKVRIDTGFYDPGWARKWEFPLDEKWQTIKFKKPADAHNWLSVRGWELYHTSIMSNEGAIGQRAYIYRRLEPYRR